MYQKYLTKLTDEERQQLEHCFHLALPQFVHLNTRGYY